MKPSTNGHASAEGHVTIENVGPVEGRFDLDLSAGCGVYVLRGSKGSGKSTTLTCLELLAGHTADITLHDGAQSGLVSGFGVVAPVSLARKSDGSARVQRKGEFAASSLDAERFGIADVTDPGIKDPAKADAHRIKALARLTRAKSDPVDYHDIAGGREQFELLVRLDDLPGDDPVLLAARVKAAFDAAARNSESLADRAEGQAQACHAAVNGLDVTVECDQQALAEAVEAAAAERTRLRTLWNAAKESSRVRHDAEARLKKTRESFQGPTLEDAIHRKSAAADALDAAMDRVSELKDLLRFAEEDLARVKQQVTQAETAIQNAKQHEELVSQLEDLLSQSAKDAPSSEQLAEADAVLSQARAAQEQGVRLREAKRHWDDGNKHLEEAGQHRSRAEQMREASAGVFEVLTRSVHLEGVRVETVHGVARLVVDHPRRGPTLFSELSDGERVRKAIDLLLPVLGSPGILPVSQRLFQDLTDSDLTELDEYARERGVYVLGARVDDGPLRVQRWNDDQA